MKKEVKEKTKQKKQTAQNKLKKVLHPNNAKPISLESNTGDAKIVKKHIQKINQNKHTRKNSSNKQNDKIKKNIEKKVDTLNDKKSVNLTSGELDYLNFSKIEIFKPNSSFEEDIFDPNHLTFFEKKKITSNRYNNIDSSLDTIKTEKNSNTQYIQPSQENKLKTPSTICNYYENSEYTSSTKKNIKLPNEDNKTQLKVNLSQLYENSMVNKTQKIINWRLKDSIKITKNKSSSLNSKENLLNIPNDINNKSKINTNNMNVNTNKNLIKTEKIPFKNNLMDNYLNNKISKQRKGSFNMSSSKKNSFYNKMNINKDSLIKNLNKNHNSSTQNIHNNNNNSNNNKYNISNIPNQKYSNNKIQVNKKNTKTNNTTNGVSNNGVYYINLSKNSNMNYTNHKKINYSKKGKASQQKPIMLCYDQIKYDSYFVTPKNFNKLAKGKVSTSNKTTKIIKNNTSIGRCQNNNNNNDNSNNNTNKTVKNNLFNDNYNILIKNYFQNKNKSFSKKTNSKNNTTNNNIKKNKDIANKNQANLLSHIKSFSYLIGRTKNSANKYRNISNKKMNTGTKESSEILYDLLTNNKEKINSPPKSKKNNVLKISKTLTEQNIFSRMQTTPKYYKIPKGGKGYSTISKKNYDNTNSNTNTNTNKKYNNDYNMFINNLFKHKTQSDVKTNKYFINSNNSKYTTNGKENTNNNYYDMDKNVKQKLLDRMNNATKNNWHYIIRGNNNNNNNESQKVLLKNLSEIMQTPDKEEFLKNNTIISNESEGETDKENESKNVQDTKGKLIHKFIVDLNEYDENNLNSNNEY